MRYPKQFKFTKTSTKNTSSGNLKEKNSGDILVVSETESETEFTAIMKYTQIFYIMLYQSFTAHTPTTYNNDKHWDKKIGGVE